MSIKRKLGLGMASAALGLSLVGGGTFAYFSDEATIHNSIAAGTLSFDVTNNSGSHPINFDLTNFRPGDKIKRSFKLNNTGSLAIEKTFMEFTNANVTLNGAKVNDTLRDEFLKTLTVSYFYQLNENSEWKPIMIENTSKDGEITLEDALANEFGEKIVNGFLDSKTGKINLTPKGIDAGKNGSFMMEIHFPETEVAQNQFQGLQATFDFHLDARQVMGTKQHPQAWGPNGYITGNEGQGTNNPSGVGAQDGVYKVDGSKTITDPVTRPTGFER